MGDILLKAKLKAGQGAPGVCVRTESRQVGEVLQGAADSQTPADGKQFATVMHERAAGRTPELLYRQVAGWRHEDG